ncbi:MAG: hypothetical protein WBF58_00465 [Xanthobacteraceae bacterium]
MTDTDPREQIERLEAQIDDLSARLESCRKFVLVARIAVTGGGLVLGAILLGAIPFDPRLMLAAMAALLGGVVVWGSNHSTAQETAAGLAAAEADRAALIGQLDLHVVAERPTLH